MDMPRVITMKRPEKGGRALEEDLKDSPGWNKELCLKFNFSFLSEFIFVQVYVHGENRITDRNMTFSSPLGGDVDLCSELIQPSIQQTNVIT